MIVNTLPRLQFVPAESVDAIHRASLRILAEVGIAFLSQAALDVLEATPGSRVDRDLQRVFHDPAGVEAAVASAPATITYYGRNPKHTVTCGGDHVVFRSVGGCAFTMDEERGRRPGRLQDLIELIKLCSSIDELDIVGTTMVEPQDVPVPLRPNVNRYIAVKYSDKPTRIGQLAPSAGDLDRDIRADFWTLVEVVFGSDWDCVKKPITNGHVNPISPLCYDERMSQSLMNHAFFGQPVEIMSAAIAGITAPMTLAGAMAQQNAEVLAGIVLCQAVRPGTPVVYGTLTTIGDMKVGAPAYGSAEHALAVSIGAQLARKYGLPSCTGGTLTDSKLPDAQAGYERMLTLLTAFLVGSQYILHGVGMAESYLTSSYELIVMDSDLIGTLRRLAEGVPVDDKQIALDVIKEVGPQGMFLMTDHTFRTFRGAYFEPRLADRLMHADWARRGGKSIVRRATERWQELLRTHREPPLDPQAEQALRELILRDESSIWIGDREDWPRELVGLGRVGSLV